MLERNDVIHTIYEADLSVKAVYNRFFETDSCILYVVDAQERFTGVITSGIFGRGGGTIGQERLFRDSPPGRAGGMERSGAPI